MAEPNQSPAAPAQKSPAASVPMVSDGKTLAFKPRNFEELWAFVQTIAPTEMVPAADRGKPGQIIAKIQYGSEVGLPPMQALRYIAVLPNGLPTIYGDGCKMLVTSHPLCEGLEELPSSETVAKGYGECTIKRKGWAKPVTRRFTIEMAQKAGLWGGTGDTDEKRKRSAWYKYDGRMLQWRAFHLCVSDSIPEALGGLVPREIADDYDIVVTATPIADSIPIPQPIPTEVQSSEPEQGTTEPGEKSPGAAAESDQGGGGVPDSADNNQTAGEGDKKPQERTQKAKPAPLVERVSWINDPSRKLEEFTEGSYPFQNIKVLSQGEQAAVFRAFNDRKQALLKEQEEKAPSD